MAFGITRNELLEWKSKVARGEIAFLTHYWLHPKFPQFKLVTKVGCSDVHRLTAWGMQYGLKPEWIHLRSGFPHFDLLGDKQKEILIRENQWEQLTRFGIRVRPD